MRVAIEFTGISRILTGKTECMLSLDPNSSLRDVVVSLAKKYPELIGEVIKEDGETLFPDDVISLNGEKIFHGDDLQLELRDGDKLFLLSLLAGG